MKKLLWSMLTVIAVLTVALPLYADPFDQYFNEKGDNMASSWGYSVNTHFQDPLSGMYTLVYFLRPDVFVPAKFTIGDWGIRESSTGPVGDVVRFEIVPNPSVPGTNIAAAFIFSDDTGHGYPADVGLPAYGASYSPNGNYLQLLNDTGGSTGFNYFPTSGQPGFLVGGWNNSAVGYGLESYDAPEPATLLLLGSGLIGLAGYGRKKLFKK